MDKSRKGRKDIKLSRRRFLEYATLASAGFVGGLAANEIWERNKSTVPSNLVKTSTASEQNTQKEKVSVAISKFNEISSSAFEFAVKDQIELLGGWIKFEKLVKGKKVVLKPNWIDPISPDTGVTTNPYLVRAVAKLSLQAGAEEVILGESPGNGSFDFCYRMTGTKDVVADLPFLKKGDFSNEEVRKVSVPDFIVMQKISQPESLWDAVLITLPKFKTHGATRITLALKNQVGTMPSSRYARWHDELIDKYKAAPDEEKIKLTLGRKTHAKNKMHTLAYYSWKKLQGGEPILGADFNVETHALIADINTINKPGLSLIDASTGIEGDGPVLSPTSNTVDMKERVGSYMLIGSYDPVAVDVIGAMIMNWTKEELQAKPGIMMLHYAEQKGLGVGPSGISRIKVKGVDTLPDANFRRSHYRHARYSAYWFLPDGPGI